MEFQDTGRRRDAATYFLVFMAWLSSRGKYGWLLRVPYGVVDLKLTSKSYSSHMLWDHAFGELVDGTFER